MVDLLFTGILLGLSAGFAPGPLFTLVLSETLRAGIKPGLQIAITPLVADLPLIFLSLYLFNHFSELQSQLGYISLLGGTFILSTAISNMHFQGEQHTSRQGSTHPFTKGLFVNLLNPHPYLFWFTVGAPTLFKASTISTVAPWLFIGSFYALLVGSKMLLALIAARSRSFLKGHIYIYTMRLLGGVLALFAVTLFQDGLERLGILPL